MKRILIKNSFFGILQILTNVVLVFFAVPVFIKLLGSQAYGVFALIMVIGNLNTFTNLGLTSALVKFIAEQGKNEDSNIDIIVNFILLFAMVFPFTLLAIFFTKFILINIINVPLSLYSESKSLYVWVLWANFLLILGQVFKSILDALQKVYLSNLQLLIYNILYWGLILLVLLLKFNLSEVGFVIFISALIWLLLTMYYSLNEWGKIKFNGLTRNFKKSAKKQLSYGLRIYSAGMLNFLYEPLTKILVANFIGVAEVGFYDIALKIRSQLLGFITNIFYPLFPFISEQRDRAIIRKYIHDLEQKTFFLIIPLIVMIILLMKPFITIWIGKDIEIITVTAIFIVTLHLLGSTVIPNYQFLIAKNLAQKTIILQLSNVVFNVLFILIGVKLFGYYSLIMGNIAAIASSFCLSLYYQNKYLQSLIFDSFLQVFKLIIIFLIVLLVGLFVKLLLTNNYILLIIIEPFIIITLVLSCYKYFNIIRMIDITRYFGNKNKLSRILLYFYNT